jgi:hypothetical protein
MAKYRVYAIMYATKEIATIEADSKEEAIKKGWNHPDCEPGSLCWQCSDEYELNEIEEVKAEIIEE